MARLFSVLLAALLMAPASPAQSASGVLDAWRSGWDQAMSQVASVSANESLSRYLRGPRGTVETRTGGQVVFVTGERPQQAIDARFVSDEPVSDDQFERVERRYERALGRSARIITRPPMLPGDLLRAARADALERVAEGGRTLLRVQLRLGSREIPAIAWFSRSRNGVALVRLSYELTLREGASIERTTEYVRLSGLDLPLSTASAYERQQRRRLRSYSVALTTEGSYSRHTVVRADRR